ncbi:MAG TPA: hypothetical protein PLB10_11135 [Thiolinea sp.]|nr:hypothetical protein [Thiolinea sp.]
MKKCHLISTIAVLTLMTQSGLSLAESSVSLSAPAQGRESTITDDNSNRVRHISTSDRQRLLRERRAARQTATQERNQAETTDSKAGADEAAATDEPAPEKTSQTATPVTEAGDSNPKLSQG